MIRTPTRRCAHALRPPSWRRHRSQALNHKKKSEGNCSHETRRNGPENWDDQVFDEEGRALAVTVVKFGENLVTQKITVDKNGYQAVQVGGFCR